MVGHPLSKVSNSLYIFISFHTHNQENSRALISLAMVDESIDHENDVTCNATKGKFRRTREIVATIFKT